MWKICGYSLLVKLDNFLLQVHKVRRLKVKLLIFLLQECEVLLELHLLLRSDFSLHPRQSLLLGLLSDLSFEALILNPLFQHADLITVESFDIVDH